MEVVWGHVRFLGFRNITAPMLDEGFHGNVWSCVICFLRRVQGYHCPNNGEPNEKDNGHLNGNLDCIRPRAPRFGHFWVYFVGPFWGHEFKVLESDFGFWGFGKDTPAEIHAVLQAQGKAKPTVSYKPLLP